MKRLSWRNIILCEILTVDNVPRKWYCRLNDGSERYGAGHPVGDVQKFIDQFTEPTRVMVNERGDRTIIVFERGDYSC